MTREPKTLLKILEPAIESTMKGNREDIPDVKERLEIALSDRMFHEDLDAMIKTGERAIEQVKTCEESKMLMSLVELRSNEFWESTALRRFNDSLFPYPTDQVHFGGGSFGNAIPSVLGEHNRQVILDFFAGMKNCGCAGKGAPEKPRGWKEEAPYEDIEEYSRPEKRK